MNSELGLAKKNHPEVVLFFAAKIGSVRLSNPTHHLTESTVHISDFGGDAGGQVRQQKCSHIAYIFDGHISADG